MASTEEPVAAVESVPKAAAAKQDDLNPKPVPAADAVKVDDAEAAPAVPQADAVKGEDAQGEVATPPVPQAEAVKQEEAKTAAPAPAHAVDSAPQVEKSPPKKLWGDEVDDDDPVLETLLDGLSVSRDEGGIVDKPDISLKSDVLNESVEAPETGIRKVLAQDTPYTSAKTFEDLNLSESLLRGIYSEMKFEKPSKIQAETLPLILTPPYQNLIAQAHNGSGKTTCFVLGMLSRVNPAIKAPQALCVCPTRELANQNEEVLLKMGKYTGITSACTASAETAGVSSSRRDKIVDQVIIGTPGTLKRWMTKDRILSTRDINVLVFDEADHMLDQDGFQDDSLRILNNIRQSQAKGSNLQVLLFSATFSEKVKTFALRTVPKANYIFVEREQLSLDVIKQYRVKCPSRWEKVDVLKDRIFPAAEKLGQSIIFARTRQSASELHKTLEADGFKCTSIQGGLQHEERDRVIREFRSGETKILIATDVLARGFDQAQVTLVVNYDIPTKSTEPHDPDYELYLHRIGRSGRFGRKGAAFNLCANDKDNRNVDLIAQHFNRVIPEVPWNDDDAFEAVLKEAGLA